MSARIGLEKLFCNKIKISFHFAYIRLSSPFLKIIIAVSNLSFNRRIKFNLIKVFRYIFIINKNKKVFSLKFFTNIFTAPEFLKIHILLEVYAY